MCSQKILKKMRLQKEGSLVNMASIYGVVGPDFSIYKDIPKMTMPAAYSAIKGYNKLDKIFSILLRRI